MPYMCTLCNKTHANAYKKHLKYKKEVLTTRKEEPDFEKLKSDIKKIKEVLGIWAWLIERKHPYWNSSDEFEEWVEDGN